MKLPEIFTIYKMFDILNVPKYNESTCNSYLAQLNLTWSETLYDQTRLEDEGEDFTLLLLLVQCHASEDLTDISC